MSCDASMHVTLASRLRCSHARWNQRGRDPSPDRVEHGQRGCFDDITNRHRPFDQLAGFDEVPAHDAGQEPIRHRGCDPPACNGDRQVRDGGLGHHAAVVGQQHVVPFPVALRTLVVQRPIHGLVEQPEVRRIDRIEVDAEPYDVGVRTGPGREPRWGPPPPSVRRSARSLHGDTLHASVSSNPAATSSRSRRIAASSKGRAKREHDAARRAMCSSSQTHDPSQRAVVKTPGTMASAASTFAFVRASSYSVCTSDPQVMPPPTP